MEINRLKIIADDIALTEELKQLFLNEFETLPVELGFSNERLGERERARLEGKLAVERVFTKILAQKTLPIKPVVVNRSR